MYTLFKFNYVLNKVACIKLRYLVKVWAVHQKFIQVLTGCSNKFESAVNMQKEICFQLKPLFESSTNGMHIC